MSTVRILVATVAALASPAAASPLPYGRLVAVTPSPVSGPLAYRLIAWQEAARDNLPYDLVDAVMKIESDYRPDRIGDVGEIGLMQVRPETAAMLGFRGDAQALADPATNIHYGATYLGRAWHLAGGDVCRALMKYRAGHGEEVMSPLSMAYCARAHAHLAAMRSPLAAGIDVAALAADEPARPARPAAKGHGFWAGFEARIRRINARIESKWRRVATR